MKRFSSFALGILCAVVGALTMAATTGVVIKNDSNGYLIGTSSADKIAFHGKAPVALLSSANQTALTDNSGGSVSDATLAVVTAPSALTDNTTGTASTTLASISDTATKNAIASLAARQAENRAAIVSLTNAVAKEAELVNQLRSDLVSLGLIRGGAAP